jgi:hypothetical protein
VLPFFAVQIRHAWRGSMDTETPTDALILRKTRVWQIFHLASQQTIASPCQKTWSTAYSTA